MSRSHDVLVTRPCLEQNGRHVLRETLALPSFTQCDDVSLCLERIIGSNSVDFRVECFIMTPFGCPVTRTSRAVMCVSMETQKNVTNHRGESQNKQSGFKRTCPTCDNNIANSKCRTHLRIMWRLVTWHHYIAAEGVEIGKSCSFRFYYFACVCVALQPGIMDMSWTFSMHWRIFAWKNGYHCLL